MLSEQSIWATSMAVWESNRFAEVTVIKLRLVAILVLGLCTLSSCGRGLLSLPPPPPAAILEFTAPVVATTGASFAFTLTARGSTGQVATGYTGTVHFTSDDPQASLPADSTLTNGVGGFNATFNTDGRHRLTATDTKTPTLKGNSLPIGASGAATHFSVIAPGTATVGTAIGIRLEALDAAGHQAFTYTGTAHFTSSDAQANLPADSTLFFGLQSFGAGFKNSGNQTITATDTATVSITVTTGPIAVSAAAAANAIPLINNPLSPSAAAPSGGAFTLTVDGTGFVSGATVNWNGSPRATTFVSSSKLTASILAADIATASTASITVTNPAPGGGTSNSEFFEVINPVSSVSLTAGPPISIANAFRVYAADLNRDGKQDLVVLGDTVSVLLGNGDGTFQAPVAYNVDIRPLSAVIGDFNGDGIPDVVVSGAEIHILLGKGDGTFQAAVQVSDSGLGTLAAADLNGDGKLDLILTGIHFNILFGNGDGTFQPRVTFDSGLGFFAATIGDFNGDGKLDLAAPTFPFLAAPATPQVEVLLGNGDGTYQSPATIAAGVVPVGVIAADLNGDGNLDLIVTTTRSVNILLGKGDGTFQAPTVLSVLVVDSLAVADINGDGKPDIITTIFGLGGAPSSVGVLLGNGDGTFQPLVTFQVADLSAGFAVADFKGNGKLGVAVADRTSSSVFILSQP